MIRRSFRAPITSSIWAPGAAAKGGEILYAGKSSGLPGRETSTGRLLLIRTLHRQKKRKVEQKRGAIVIRGAREHNLKIDRIEIPLHNLVCVTGVSGSGKSTLVESVLHENWLKGRGLGGQEAGACDGVDGFDAVEDVLMMSQAPIGRSLRSNPATYIKCYDEIRKLFASTAAARRAKISPGSFSFNTVGGRCERCQGTGTVRSRCISWRTSTSLATSAGASASSRRSWRCVTATRTSTTCSS
jgi:excinuclease ABC subunit A